MLNMELNWVRNTEEKRGREAGERHHGRRGRRSERERRQREGKGERRWEQGRGRGERRRRTVRRG